MEVSPYHLEQHKKLVSFAKDNNIVKGRYWTEASKTFDVELNKDGYLNKGSRNYLPEILKKEDSTVINEDLVHLKSLLSDSILDSLEKVNVEKNFFEINGRRFLYTKTFLHQLYYFLKIRSEVESFSPDTILEIGGGSGLMAAILKSELGSKIFIVDLPEMFTSSYAFLAYVFPDSKILLSQEIADSSNFDDFDFIFLTPDQVNLIKDESINFSLNVASFQEMDFSEVQKYFGFINRCLSKKGYFFCANRINKETRFSKYPWDSLVGFSNIFLEKGSLRSVFQPDDSFFERLVCKSEDRTMYLDKIKNDMSYLSKKERQYWLLKDLGLLRLKELLLVLVSKLK